MWYKDAVRRRAREGIEWLRAIGVSAVRAAQKAVELPPACRQAAQGTRKLETHMLMNLGQRDEPSENGNTLKARVVRVLPQTGSQPIDHIEAIEIADSGGEAVDP
jgi:hypothetical protein